MIKITRIESSYHWDEDAEYPASEEGEAASVSTEELTFRELVSAMRDMSETSCWPATGATSEWLTTRREDYRTGGWVEESIHFDRDQSPHRARYWAAAMRAAGHAR